MAAHRPACFVRRILDLAQLVGRITDRTLFYRLGRYAHRFPSRWIVEELDACFVVTDGGGQKLAYVYFEDEPGRRSAAKLLSEDETRRIASKA
jgi:hypothetical protein